MGKFLLDLGKLLMSPFGLLIRLVKISLPLVLIGLFILAILYFGFGIGLGNGFGAGKGNGVSEIVAESNESSVAMESTVDQDNEEPKETKAKVENIEVTVNGNEFWYQNNRVSVEELIKLIETKKTDIVVQISDDNASRNAYSNIINSLREAHIPYEEKN